MYPKKNQDISEYTLAVIASNNVFNYLLQQITLLDNLGIKFKNLFVADLGILPEQKEETSCPHPLKELEPDRITC